MENLNPTVAPVLPPDPMTAVRELAMPEVQVLLDQVGSYLTPPEQEVVSRALLLAELRHRGQRRASGEPYILHPIAVTGILAAYRMDAPTLAAALLHDTVEDTGTKLQELTDLFGTEISMMVDGVTKLTSISSRQGREAPRPLTKQMAQAENLRKIFLAMAKDLRVILIKLADRLHNLRTLGSLRAEKQKSIATETLEIFAPIASRLGVYKMKTELEDLSFRYAYPEEYAALEQGMNELRPVLEKSIQEATRQMAQRLEQMQIRAKMEWREKHFYSTYKKMQRTQRPLDEIYDLVALRVVVEKVEECYSVLGAVHSIWVPMKDRIKDYIAVPKSNNYRSLHTTIYGPGDHPLEIQIRTYDMHQVNEVGIAAHWAYKEGKRPPSKDAALFKEIYPWIRAILDWQDDSRDAKEYIDNLKVDLLSNEVFVFTPGGDVIDLPTGSGPIDFAYRVHTQVGHRCIGAKVNGKMVPFDYKLQNADIVEVVTSKNGTPSLDWLRICGSNQARNKIRGWFKKERHAENVQRGRDILRRELSRQRLDGVLNDEPVMFKVAQSLNFTCIDDLLASLGFGETSLPQILGRLRDALPKEASETLLPTARPRTGKKKSGQPVRVRGIENILVRFSRCCTPVPGDSIVGYITLGKGVSVHLADCPNFKSLVDKTPERVIEVEWESNLVDEANSEYFVELDIDCWDRNGLLSDILSVINDARIPARSCKAWAKKGRALIKISIEIAHKKQLEELMKRIKKVKDVVSVSRMQTQAQS